MILKLIRSFKKLTETLQYYYEEKYIQNPIINFED